MVTRTRALCLARGVVVALGLCGLAGATHAAAASKTKIAVLEVRPVGTFDPKTVAGLTAVIAAEAGRREDVQATSGSEIAAMLGFERQKQVLACASESCLAEIGAALGVSLLLSSEVSQVGTKWLFSAALIDTTKGKVRARVAREATDATDLVEVARRATISVLSSGLGESKVVAAALAAEASAARPRRIGGYVTIAVGGAALIGSGIAAVLAQSRYNDLKDAGARGDATAYDQAKRATRQLAMTTDILLGVGVAAAATGLVLVLTAPRQPDAVAFTISPTSATATVKF